MYLKWDDCEEIAKELSEKYPDLPPVALSDESIRQKVITLEKFKDSPHPSDNDYLAGIQDSWIALWHGEK